MKWRWKWGFAVFAVWGCAVLAASAAPEQRNTSATLWEGVGVAISADGTPIAFETRGEGEPAIVLVHGWCCDSRYWKNQLPALAQARRVVTVDLAGHGHSGAGRARWTMHAFGEDVRAAVEAAGCERVVLVGHSMGGTAVAEAARLLPGRVVGIIGVDTLENVDFQLPEAAAAAMVAPFEADFKAAMGGFTEGLFTADANQALKAWITADMASAEPTAATAMMREYVGESVRGESGNVFHGMKVPVVSLMGSLWPADVEGNRKHIASYEAAVLADTGHFGMLEKPAEFNRALALAIRRVEDLSAESVASDANNEMTADEPSVKTDLK